MDIVANSRLANKSKEHLAEIQNIFSASNVNSIREQQQQPPHHQHPGKPGELRT